jgi:hypothetical protein
MESFKAHPDDSGLFAFVSDESRNTVIDTHYPRNIAYDALVFFAYCVIISATAR